MLLVCSLLRINFSLVCLVVHMVCFVNLQVGLIIGKGGETIKNMQASTGARIQVFTSK